ncbi:nitroreductase family protein [Halanaerobium congolense]|uniref:Nitroreductase family protein n=1 Tax=Halanaerobium congolense TaxID=54121 RepID=A0A318DZS5_9FIRM|nr:nitroreductase family protein [Halanaerobium congolense]PXV63689.1 nitroreductase family protein [Halanaerobium congolense]
MEFVMSFTVMPKNIFPMLLIFQKKKSIRCSNTQRIWGGAPVHIIVSYEIEEDPIKDEEALMGASAAVQNLMLTAADQNLGTVWIAGHVAHSERVKELLNLSDSEKIAGIVPIGIPDMDPPLKERQDSKEKTEWIGF